MEPAVGMPLAAEPHETLCSSLVAIADRSHDVELPVFSIEPVQYDCARDRVRFHDDGIGDRNGAEFANCQNLIRQQQIGPSIGRVIRRLQREAGIGGKNSVTGIHNRRFRTAGIYDGQSSADCRSIIEKKSWMADMVGRLNGYVTDFQTGTMSDKILQSPKSVLLTLNVGLLSAYEHLPSADDAHSLSQPSSFFVRFPECVSERADKSRGDGSDDCSGSIEPAPQIPSDDVKNVMGGATFLATVLIGFANLMVRLWVRHEKQNYCANGGSKQKTEGKPRYATQLKPQPENRQMSSRLTSSFPIATSDAKKK